MPRRNGVRVLLINPIDARSQRPCFFRKVVHSSFQTEIRADVTMRSRTVIHGTYSPPHSRRPQRKTASYAARRRADSPCTAMLASVPQYVRACPAPISSLLARRVARGRRIIVEPHPFAQQGLRQYPSRHFFWRIRIGETAARSATPAQSLPSRIT